MGRALALAGAAMATAAGTAHAQTGAVRVGDRILDPATFANITYEGTVNISSFQQDGLLTAAGYQYTAWYRADRRVTISRRKLPDGAWRSIELDALLQVSDSHNTISMAATPSDGRLHIALGTHGTAIRYIRSIPGITSRPGDVAWSSKSFEAVRSSLPGAWDAVGAWTYPMFETVGGHLMLTYRDGSTDNGRNVLARYNHDTAGTWTYLGQFSASTGNYTSPFGTSSSRYAYLHGFGANPLTGDIEISWSWRERTSAWCSASGLGNHDLGYARSPDGGLTWRNNAGLQIAATGGSDQISIDDPHVVVPIAINRGLINQEAQTFDNEGRVHVMTSQFNDADLAKLGGCHTSTYSQRAQYARPYHHWRAPDGTWHTTELPFYSGSAGRTKLLFDRADNAYLVLPDGRIAVATAATSWSDWRIVFAASDVDNIAELIVDRQRLQHDGVLSVAYQETSSNSTPSAFRVADFVLNDPTREPVPKATEPEAAPVPYEGSAPGDPQTVTATATSSQPGYPPALAVDGNASTFWVSGGTAEGQGPQPSRPEIVTLEYTSVQTVREVRVTPRTTAIGPRAFAIEARVDGAWRRLGDFTQGNTAQTFVVPLTRADAIRLVITAAYDQGRPPERARNVQISEVALVSSDKLAPVSSATAPAAGTVGTAIAVDWTASDAEPSWGLAQVELYVKGPHDTTFAKADTDSIPGASGRFMFVPARGVGRYELYTVAVDQAGHTEDAPSTADAMIDVGPRTLTQEGGVGGVVPPTLALTLSSPAAFGAFTPGVERTYEASTIATVTSTAGDASLSVADPSTVATGHLVNGMFALPRALTARAGSGGAFAPVTASTTLLDYRGPVSNDAVTVTFQQTIGTTDALRTGSYAKTLLFTLATSSP